MPNYPFKKYRQWQKKLSRISYKSSIFVLCLLFTVSLFTPVVLAKIPNAPAMISQSQDGTQLVNEGAELFRRGEIAAAADKWEKASDFFASKGDKLNQAIAMSNLAFAAQRLGNWQKSDTSIKTSLDLLNALTDSREKSQALAQTLDIQGNLLREKGQLVEAGETWQKAAEIYSKINQPEKSAQSRINQAQALQDLGFYPRACKTLLDVLGKMPVSDCRELSQIPNDKFTGLMERYKQQPPNQTLSVALRGLGELMRFVGQSKKAQEFLETSLFLTNKLNNPQEQAITYISLGNSAQALAEAETVREKRTTYENNALKYYEQAIKLATLPSTRQQAQVNKLSWLVKLTKFYSEKTGEKTSEGEYSQQIAELWRSLNSEFSNIPPSRTGVYQQINFADSLIKISQGDSRLKDNSQFPNGNDIDQVLVKAINQAKTLKDKNAQAYAWGSRGKLYEHLYELNKDKNHLALAEEYTKQAVAIASTFEAPNISYQYFWQLGRIQYADNRIEEAIAAYTKSYNALQSLRGDLVTINPELQFSFRESVEPVYRQLVELNLKYAETLQPSASNKANDKQQSTKQAQLLNQARTVVESLQIAEINNFFQEACVETKAQTIDNIDKKAAVIYPIILPDRVEVILSLAGENPRLYTTMVKREELEKTIEEARGNLQDYQIADADALPIYQNLYNWLLRPLEQDLAAKPDINTLSFVLDGDLRNIPMSVLHDGKEYLVEKKYAIAITPGLQLVDPKPINQVELRAFAGGLSQIRPDSPESSQFEPLPNVEKELKEIQALGLSGEPILNNEFTIKQIQGKISDTNFPIVHLATHGKFSSNAEDTFILAWDDRIKVRQIDNILRGKVLNLSKPIELFILSACQTAEGDRRATLGMAGMAIRAGARSTLATLWEVADESTAILMKDFYVNLKQAKAKNINRAEALHQAQLALLKTDKFKNPNFWAPFVLIGNWL
ncbi:CHAT domain-containing protein [Calothrix sp. 336/3]|uniref:CHAT domain-containing protein n=1 Tax=Calothrix sp. 336/3 TaxID=1337936 RepID=UPI0006244B7C|nr:CHAT domain-containing protein [Calothrix sp. 336/3]AKG23193.1 hypothetical protein IJ00_19650 [Calothrix sp. 336/3]